MFKTSVIVAGAALALLVPPPADGRTMFRVRVPAVEGQLRLLGQRSDGAWWVAAQTRKAQRVFRVGPDGARTAVPRTRTPVRRQLRTGWLLSRGGTHLVQTAWGAYGVRHVIRDATTGDRLQRLDADGYDHPLDAGRVLVRLDGALVLGTRLTRTFDRKPRVLELRRLSDGRLLQAFRYGGRTETSDIHTQDEQTARFESASRFVFEVGSGDRAILVRCTAGGSCQRASGWARRISVPHEKYVWWRRLNS